MDPGTSL
jgi:hypothetical protein